LKYSGQEEHTVIVSIWFELLNVGRVFGGTAWKKVNLWS